MRLPHLLRSSLSPLVVALLVLGAVAPPAHACAVLPTKGSEAPDLSHERVLILFDRAAHTEHFVREVRFARATSRFAFLVPTPSRPEVEKVDEPPFDALDTHYPLTPPEPAPQEPKSMRVTAVEVHEVKTVGSFTAFVLSATDPAALDAWLTENDIGKPDNAQQWLAHFVEKKFFLTAFRYEPPEGAAGEIDAETVRLSFKTNDAYYPYIEPLRAEGSASRSLDVWTIANETVVPTALFAPVKGPVFWNVAWQEGAAYDASPADLKTQLPGVAAFLPAAGSLRVQTFFDGRSNRNGVSDVVLAREGDRPDDPAFRARATALLGNLEKLPHTGENYPPAGGAKLDALRAHPISRGCACRQAGNAEDGPLPAAAALSGLVALLAARRRKR